MKVPAGKHLLDLVAVDWFKDTKRMDHVARRQGCAAQVSTSPANPSLVLCCSSQTSKLTLVKVFFSFSLLLSFTMHSSNLCCKILKFIPFQGIAVIFHHDKHIIS
jgi:hypothetical protein